MNEKLYDILAIIGRLILPALGTLYFTLAQIWKLPLGEEVTGTLAALTVFINTILRIEYSRWEDEQELEDEDDN